MSRTKKPVPRVAPAPHRIIARSSAELRERARRVREEVAADYKHIEAEGEEALQAALAARRLYAIRVLFQPGERDILRAIDAYAGQHGLNSRAQVVRVALQRLLRMDLAVQERAWKKGRPRKLAK